MEQIMVNSSVSVHNIGILGICIFAFIGLYLIITSSLLKNEAEKIKTAKEMILEGHENAMNGRKDDGYYKETRRLRDNVTVSDDEPEEDAKNEETEEEEASDEDM